VIHSPPARPDALKEYARALYEKLAEAIDDEKLLPFGISIDNIQIGVTLISEIEDLSKKYQDLKSNKEFSTAERNRIFRKFKKVWKAFDRKCRELFYDTPHVLEGIIPVPSEGFKRRPVRTKPEEPETPEDPGTPEEPGTPEDPVTPEEPNSSETGDNAVEADASMETRIPSPVEVGGTQEHEEVFVI
jgi:hypothetical protein